MLSNFSPWTLFFKPSPPHIPGGAPAPAPAPAPASVPASPPYFPLSPGGDDWHHPAKEATKRIILGVTGSFESDC